MREIKFRAWDKDLGEMHYGGFYVSNGGGVVDADWGKWDNKAKRAIGCENLELMQYTGLKDKNGKEIYEGDIVEVNTDWQRGIRKTVTYDNDATCFALVTKETECGILKETALRCYEVIGNIYENKELLSSIKE